MYGAILGDIIGSAYEFDYQNYKAKDFPLFCRRSTFTDDTVMTLAVAAALMKVSPEDDDETIKRELVKSMQTIGRHYPNCGYGRRFYEWMFSKNPHPYNSCGNGSGMRVSSVAWFYNDMDTVLRMAKLTADVSHNHPEGVKGAQAVASCIFLARTGKSKAEIKAYVEEKFHYDLSRTCDEIRPGYRHVETCQGSVPEAIIAFLEGTDFEDVIRTAVSIGGDSDTIADMAGAIAEAFYGVPEELEAECYARLPNDLADILRRAKERTEKLTPPPVCIGGERPLSEVLETAGEQILSAFLAGKDYRDILLGYNAGIYNYQDYFDRYENRAMNPHGSYSLEECFLCLTIIWREDYWGGGTEDYSRQVGFFTERLIQLMRLMQS